MNRQTADKRIHAVREEIAYHAGTIGMNRVVVPLAQQQAENALRDGQSGYRAIEIGKAACETLASYERL